MLLVRWWVVLPLLNVNLLGLITVVHRCYAPGRWEGGTDSFSGYVFLL